MHKEQKAAITQKKMWGDYCLLGLKTERIAEEAQPGQFIMVRPTDNFTPLLRRPISIHSVREKSMEIFFQMAGMGTTILGQKEPGELLDIIGPLGKGFRLGSSPGGKHAALIGGGRGIAPLYFLAHKLREQDIIPHVFYGGRTHADIPLEKKFSHAGFKTFLATDDGSRGFKGFVTDLFQASLRESAFSRIYACGPEAMMAKVARIARERKIAAEFSLESIMGCGFGACWGCVRKIRHGNGEEWRKICEDGPVFPGEQIIWQEGGEEP